MSDVAALFIEPSGLQRQSPGVMVPGYGSRPLRAAAVLPTPCSSCEPTRKAPDIRVRGTRFPSAPSCSLWGALPARPHPSHPDDWMGHSRRSTASCHYFFSSFHLILLYCMNDYRAHRNSCISLSDFTATLCTHSPLKHSNNLYTF